MINMLHTLFFSMSAQYGVLHIQSTANALHILQALYYFFLSVRINQRCNMSKATGVCPVEGTIDPI